MSDKSRPTKSQKPSPPRKYVPAVGPRLKRVLAVVFALFALLGVNSVYLSAVTFAEWSTGDTYQNYFYLTMFLVHLGLGLAIIVPARKTTSATPRNGYRTSKR